MFVFNPIKLEHKSVQGAISTATKLNITVKYSGDLVELHIKKDGGNYKAYPMTTAPSKDSFFVCLEPMDKGLYFYHFVADGTFLARQTICALKSRALTAIAITSLPFTTNIIIRQAF